MKKIIAFAGTNSKQSINKQLATYAANQLKDAEVSTLDLNDFELPLYGIDLEMESGIPENAHRFLETIKSSDGIVLSLAEHNGVYSAVFKNLIDWMSRIENKLFANTPMLLMATSPGGRGGMTVLELGKTTLPFMGANIVADFSLPSFGQNFSDDGIIDDELNKKFKFSIDEFIKAI